MKTLFVAMALLSTTTFAASTYRGQGSWQLASGGSATTYKITAVVEHSSDKKVVRVVETYDDGKQKPMTLDLVFRFADNGLLKVEKKGVVIGCGYCVPQGENRWCDYKLHTDEGMLHVNFYFDAKSSTMHRMGDMITPKGVGFWSDTLKLQK